MPKPCMKRRSCATKSRTSKSRKSLLRKRLDRSGPVFLNRFPARPADSRRFEGVTKTMSKLRLKHQQFQARGVLAPFSKAPGKKLDYFQKDQKGKLGDYLNDPEKRAPPVLILPPNRNQPALSAQKLLAQLLETSGRNKIFFYHVLASYEIRANRGRPITRPCTYSNCAKR